MYILFSEREAKIDLKNFSTWKKTALLSGLAGIAYLLGLFLMPTIIVFALIVVIFTVIQFIINVYRNASGEYLLVANTIIFAIAIIGLLIFGFKSPTIDLSTYSIGHVYAYIALIAGTAVLYLLARYLKGKEKYYYPLSLVGLAVIFAGVLFVVSPQFFNQLISAAFQFFGQAPVTDTVQEARGWSMASAWSAFNYGLILMLGGILVILYNAFREDRPHEIFALVWSAVILYSTWQHVRYEYYLAINIALLSAICISFVIGLGWRDISRLARNIKPECKSRGLKGGCGRQGIKRQETEKSAEEKSLLQPPPVISFSHCLLLLPVLASCLCIRPYHTVMSMHPAMPSP